MSSHLVRVAFVCETVTCSAIFTPTTENMESLRFSDGVLLHLELVSTSPQGCSGRRPPHQGLCSNVCYSLMSHLCCPRGPQVHESGNVCVSVSVCLGNCVYLGLGLSVSVSLCLCVYVGVCLGLCLCVCAWCTLCLDLCMCLGFLCVSALVCVAMCIFVWVRVCLVLCVCVYLF